eukprot:6183610-Pleurochrysis_carterae.AAC.1
MADAVSPLSHGHPTLTRARPLSPGSATAPPPTALIATTNACGRARQLDVVVELVKVVAASVARAPQQRAPHEARRAAAAAPLRTQHTRSQAQPPFQWPASTGSSL